VKTGYYQTCFGKYPKIQNPHHRAAFAGKRPAIPLVDPSGFKKAAKEEAVTVQERLF
jgi:hypothetical protein